MKFKTLIFVVISAFFISSSYCVLAKKNEQQINIVSKSNEKTLKFVSKEKFKNLYFKYSQGSKKQKETNWIKLYEKKNLEHFIFKANKPSSSNHSKIQIIIDYTALEIRMFVLNDKK